MVCALLYYAREANCNLDTSLRGIDKLQKNFIEEVEWACHQLLYYCDRHTHEDIFYGFSEMILSMCSAKLWEKNGTFLGSYHIFCVFLSPLWIFVPLVEIIFIREKKLLCISNYCSCFHQCYWYFYFYLGLDI